MRLVPKPGGTKQQFRAMLFTQPFDLGWGSPPQVLSFPDAVLRVSDRSPVIRVHPRSNVIRAKQKP